jgi:hypothetical protein
MACRDIQREPPQGNDTSASEMNGEKLLEIADANRGLFG